MMSYTQINYILLDRRATVVVDKESVEMESGDSIPIRPESPR